MRFSALSAQVLILTSRSLWNRGLKHWCSALSLTKDRSDHSDEFVHFFFFLGDGQILELIYKIFIERVLRLESLEITTLQQNK